MNKTNLILAAGAATVATIFGGIVLHATAKPASRAAASPIPALDRVIDTTYWQKLKMIDDDIIAVGKQESEIITEQTDFIGQAARAAVANDQSGIDAVTTGQGQVNIQLNDLAARLGQDLTDREATLKQLGYTQNGGDK